MRLGSTDEAADYTIWLEARCREAAHDHGLLRLIVRCGRMVMPCTLNHIARLATDQPAYEEVSGDGPYRHVGGRCVSGCGATRLPGARCCGIRLLVLDHVAVDVRGFAEPHVERVASQAGRGIARSAAMAAPPYALGECFGEVRAEAFRTWACGVRKRPFLASRATPLALSAPEEMAWPGRVELKCCPPISGFSTRPMPTLFATSEAESRR